MDVSKPHRAAGRADPDPTAVALDDAFARETRQGVLLAAAGWAVYGLLLLANQISDVLTVAKNLPSLWSFTNIVLLIELATIPMAGLNYLLAARSRRPLLWCYLFMALATVVLGELNWGWLWSPPTLASVPPVIAVRYQDQVQVAVFLAVYALPLSGRLALTAGGAAALMFVVGLVDGIIRFRPTRLYWGPFDHAHLQAALGQIMRPEVLFPDFAVIYVLLIVVFVGFIALACREGRRFVIAGVRAELDRDFLGRFFPPEVAERIRAAGPGRITPARRDTAILFVDIGEASWDAPDLERLQIAYARVEAAVFAHGGMLDRFAGGPMMAAFGAVEPDAGATAKALACARALALPGQDPQAGLSMALHAGAAVCGEVSGGRTRVFSVVGDVVNTARRVLDEARRRAASLLLTEAVVDALPPDQVHGLEALGPIELRGREAPVRLWGAGA